MDANGFPNAGEIGIIDWRKKSQVHPVGFLYIVGDPWGLFFEEESKTLVA